MVTPVPVPHDCTDGFFAAYRRRPASYLNPAVRAGISGLALLDPPVARGRWGSSPLTWSPARGPAGTPTDLVDPPELDLGYRLVVAGI